jgi:hypothetical protein
MCPHYGHIFLVNMAVSERFELSLGVNLNTLSRRAPSATQPAHQLTLVSKLRYGSEKPLGTQVEIRDSQIKIKLLIKHYSMFNFLSITFDFQLIIRSKI